MNSLEDKIINKIKEEEIKPTSFWYFKIKNILLWFFVILAIIFTSLSIAPIIFILESIDYEYLKHLSNNPLLFIIFQLPFLWIILSIIFSLLSKYLWNKTKNGYKFEGRNVLIFALIISLILGLLLNILHFGKKIDDSMTKPSFGLYRSFEERNNSGWSKKEDGRIIGIVQDVEKDFFSILIKGSDVPVKIYFEENLPGFQFIEIENKLKIIGYEINENDFFACAIFPDKFLPPKEKFKMIEKATSTNKNLDCQNILENGRAYFHPKKLKQNNF